MREAPAALIESWRQAFRSMDINQDGFVSVAELRKHVRRGGLTLQCPLSAP